MELVGEDADAVLIGGADEGEESMRVFSYMNLARAFGELVYGRRPLLPPQKPLVADLARAASRLGRIRGRARVRGRHRGDGTREAEPGVLRGGSRGARRRRSLSCMVGDDVEADIAGAQRFGMRTALVRTGKFRPDDLERSGIAPDIVVNSIAELPEWLEKAL